MKHVKTCEAWNEWHVISRKKSEKHMKHEKREMSYDRTRKNISVTYVHSNFPHPVWKHPPVHYCVTILQWHSNKFEACFLKQIFLQKFHPQSVVKPNSWYFLWPSKSLRVIQKTFHTHPKGISKTHPKEIQKTSNADCAT